MNVNTLVRRYSAAFAGYAKESIGIKRGIDELLVFKKLVDENAEFNGFLSDPEISHIEKCNFINNVMDEWFSKEFAHFIKLLITKGRISLIKEIADYMYAVYLHEGEINAVIKTAHPMGAEIMNSLRQIAEKRSGKKFNIAAEIDTSLLGGMKIEIGNTLIDASIRKDLNELKETLRTTGVI